MTLDDCRLFYADEIRIAARLDSAALVAAFASVPREKFMGPGPWQIASPDMASMASMGLTGEAYLTTDDPRDLYHNVLVALDPDRHLNNGQPSALARWIDALELRAGDRVYHLGCGVGYYTAIMAEVVGPGGESPPARWMRAWPLGLKRISLFTQTSRSTSATARPSIPANVTRYSSMPASPTRIPSGSSGCPAGAAWSCRSRLPGTQRTPAVVALLQRSPVKGMASPSAW